MRVRVEVTAGDIAGGKRSDCVACPVAQAMRRAGAPSPLAHYAGLWWWAHARVGRPTPREVTDFMHRLDAGEGVEPFSFDLDIPLTPWTTAR